MGSRTTATNHPCYSIRVKGDLDDRWSNWFGLTVINLDTGDAILFGPVADQAALHGILARIRDLNMTLISVQSNHRRLT